LNIARGSLFEMQTQFQMAQNLGFVERDDLIVINELSIEIEKMLNSLINKLSSK
jgi:four helix bundle protein